MTMTDDGGTAAVVAALTRLLDELASIRDRLARLETLAEERNDLLRRLDRSQFS
jgi:hypothetical protein